MKALRQSNFELMRIVSMVFILPFYMPWCIDFRKSDGGGYAIYLVQGGTLLLCREFIQNDWFFLLIGMIVTVVAAKWINKVNGRILDKIQ